MLLLRSPIFLAGLALRLALLPFFGSYYLRDLFIPFVDSAILSPGSNPWNLNRPEFFPYGLIQFLIVLLPKWAGYALFGQAALGQTALSVALMKLAILPFDVLLLRALVEWAPKQQTRVLIFYWLNPIVVYVTYIYGQIDLTSMFFAVNAIVLLSRGRVALSASSMAAAMLCKFHTAAIVPLLVAYLWSNNFIGPAIRKIAIWSAITLGLAFAGFLPLLFADRFFYATTTSPEALRVFSLVVDLGAGQQLYIGVLLVLAIIGRLVVATRITGQGVFFGSALIFGSLLLVTNPFPGWYLWVVPFLAVFFATYTNISPLLFGFLCVVHVAYFAWVVPQTPVGGLASGIGFTLLQTALTGTLVALYAIVIRHEVPIQGRSQPLWIGIAGDSASGKTTLAGVLQDLFGHQSTTALAGDDYHKWERGDARWEGYTHLHPSANQLLTQAEHARELQRGVAVHHPVYDHRTGAFTTPRTILPSKTVIVQGLHTFYLKHMRNSYDLKIFLEADPDLRRAWKRRRDSTERGAAISAIDASLADRDSDSRLHISPQRQFADWIIEYYARDRLSESGSADPIPVRVRHIVWNDAPIGRVCERLSELGGLDITVGPDAGDIDRTAFEIDGDVPAAHVERIAYELFPNLRHITRTRFPPRFRSGAQGVTQLISLALLGARRGLTERRRYSR